MIESGPGEAEGPVGVAVRTGGIDTGKDTTGATGTGWGAGGAGTVTTGAGSGRTRATRGLWLGGDDASFGEDPPASVTWGPGAVSGNGGKVATGAA